MKHFDIFKNRHLGINESELSEMLSVVGVKDLDELIFQTVPDKIRLQKELDLPEALSEYDYLKLIQEISKKNKIYKSYIGQGYYGTITPPVILRNIFQNPGWYTQYTPYQSEISQGRLEALLNFQTMVSDLTGLPIANASLLDEGTACAEAMAMFYGIKNKRRKDNLTNKFFIDRGVYEHTIDVLKTRSAPLNIELIIGSWEEFEPTDEYFGVLLQFPTRSGAIEDYEAFSKKLEANEIYLTVAADLLSLAILKSPGEWGANAVVGNTQRFGVPIGFGGPHAAYFATEEKYKRLIPGRIIGVSMDNQETMAYRMALQTREQHIRREKATSNICTAQALLAIMAGMYGVYHGPKGIRAIAERIHFFTKRLHDELVKLGYTTATSSFFDTVQVVLDSERVKILKERAIANEINFFYNEEGILIAIDETVGGEEIIQILSIFGREPLDLTEESFSFSFPDSMTRKSSYLQHEVFNRYHTETKMMRYIKSLENKDISLVHSMIPLGSCTMKLNAAAQLIPVSWEAFSNIHPFVPIDQAEGYLQIFEELERYLCEITGFAACSLQPNSGAQGEYAGLLTIRAFHSSNGHTHRNIALIPSSAHGTNPASAVMAGMKVVVVKTDDQGNIDLSDLREKAGLHSNNLAALMVTYPSTHGVFETQIQEICQIIHENGGKVYMDGANMNAQVGLTSPGAILADVCHLNLHKTFSIPHGGGGPGMGPICVNESLAPFLPGHVFAKTGGSKSTPAVSSAPWGSASILLISYAYIRLLGKDGVRAATEIAILNSNYIKSRLENEYSVLYIGELGRTAHELIIDLRDYKSIGISAEDVAKRLIDYGFHAPTLSFPVAGTIMIEPTESESKEELDRFCDAMLQIKKEIQEIESGEANAEDNVLHNSPHTAQMVTSDNWSHPYSREKAAYPLPYLRVGHKFWPSVGRVNNAYGDRNLMCVCPPIEMYE